MNVDHGKAVVPSPHFSSLQGEISLCSEECQHLEIERLHLENVSIEQTISLRSRFAWALFALSLVSIVAAFGVVIATGAIPGFEVSDSVLITLISSVVVEFLGVLAIVARNLFPHN